MKCYLVTKIQRLNSKKIRVAILLYTKLIISMIKNTHIVKDVFGRVSKSILENLVEMSPELEQQIQCGMTVRSGFCS